MDTTHDVSPRSSFAPALSLAWRWLELNGLAVAFVLAAFLLLGRWVWGLSAERRTLAALPAEQRLELYDRTLGNLSNLCKHEGPDVSATYCRQQARRILSFPECEAGCAALATSYLQTVERAPEYPVSVAAPR